MAGSEYAARFRNGATIYPRLFFMVEDQKEGPLGWGAGRQGVRSASSSTENAPWKDLPRLEGVIETEFVRPVLLGESILPYRNLPPRKAIIPLKGDHIIEYQSLDMYPGLAEWWRTANEIWLAHRSSERLTLSQQLDYHSKLTEQIPIPSLRVVYAKAGMHVVAAAVRSSGPIVDHTLYWGTVASEDEAMYICAILNNPALTDLVRPLMSYGKDERHIDKHVWKLPIPIYDPAKAEHLHLVHLGREQEKLVASLDLDEAGYFVTLRQKVRKVLADDPASQEVTALIQELLG
jgi:hypothetical protein